MILVSNIVFLPFAFYYLRFYSVSFTSSAYQCNLPGPFINGSIILSSKDKLDFTLKVGPFNVVCDCLSLFSGPSLSYCKSAETNSGQE